MGLIVHEKNEKILRMTRQKILEEIKRTAIENEGVPLGIKTFFKETGIKETDWKGRYWARWGDAVNEAGFLPNQKTQRYDSNKLIVSFIDLAKKLKRLPVFAELQMARNKDINFPSTSTFYGHFKGVEEWIVEAKKYCLTHKGFEDVLPLFDTISDSGTTSEEKGSDKFIDGFVYLIRMRKTHFYKLGRSNNLNRRMQEIKLPEEPDVVHYIKTDDPSGIETYWHKRFEERRKNGEWFELTASDIKAFKRRKFM